MEREQKRFIIGCLQVVNTQRISLLAARLSIKNGDHKIVDEETPAFLRIRST